MTSCVAGPSRAHCTDLAGPKGTGGARRCGQAETGRSGWSADSFVAVPHLARAAMDLAHVCRAARRAEALEFLRRRIDRKSTRLNSSHQIISYARFCLKKKTHIHCTRQHCSPPVPYGRASRPPTRTRRTAPAQVTMVTPPRSLTHFPTPNPVRTSAYDS